MDVACDSVAPTLPSAPKKLKHTQVDLVSNPRNSSGMAGYFDPLKSTSKSDSMELMNKDGSSSDFSSTNDGDAKDLDDSSDYDDEDDDEDIYDYDYDFDEYSLLQSQFDNVDLPSGVEASVPWFSAPETEKKETATSSSMMKAESSSNNMTGNENENSTPGISQISQFDVVADFSDHYYANSKFSDVKPNKNWAKKIQDEWKILKENLPGMIFVRVYDERMELLRAVIVGPSGTPYHDGLFVFDCLFPDNYPSSPPSVHYHSGGLRINPNLYNCGKVCLSLLGTWRGKNEENWIPDGSTMLQVLVSIQALILNSRPFFNEPGFESYTGAVGEQRSKKYNQDVFIKSLKTMIYTLKRPPMHFEELVGIHFRCRGRDIMLACRAYVMGAEVGSNFKDKEKNKDDKESCSKEFKSSVGNMMTLLLTSLSRNGMPGWEQFRPNLFLNEDKIDEE